MSKNQIVGEPQQIIIVQIINVRYAQPVRECQVREQASEVTKPKPAPVRSTFGAVLRRVFADMILAAL